MAARGKRIERLEERLLDCSSSIDALEWMPAFSLRLKRLAVQFFENRYARISVRIERLKERDIADETEARVLLDIEYIEDLLKEK